MNVLMYICKLLFVAQDTDLETEIFKIYIKFGFQGGITCKVPRKIPTKIPRIAPQSASLVAFHW